MRPDRGLVDDVSSAEQLIWYAVAAQVERVKRLASVSESTMASAGGGDKSSWSRALSSDGDISTLTLNRLDTAAVVLAPLSVDHVGGLLQLAIRLRNMSVLKEDYLSAHTPPAWTRDLLNTPSDDELVVLIQASVLVSIFARLTTTNKEHTFKDYYTSQFRERHLKLIAGISKRLILIGVAPPTERNVEALVLLGSLASYAFDVVWEQIENFLRREPLGFRLWRAVTKLVVTNDPRTKARIEQSLRPRVRSLLDQAEELRAISVYPGRSLDMELAIAVPLEWSQPPGDDWVKRVLLSRARNEDATIRERGTAASGIWQRHYKRHPQQAHRPLDEELNGLLQDFSSSDNSGLRWVSATIRQAIADDSIVCNEWPTTGDDFLARVLKAAEQMPLEDLPEGLRNGTKTLFKQAVLQNAGVYRRSAIDALSAGGYTEPVTSALIRLLDQPDTVLWLRVRAIFALGFLGDRSVAVQNVLRGTCERACKSLMKPNTVATAARVFEAHATLFALGDCFGAHGAEEEAPSVRSSLAPMLDQLVTTKTTYKPVLYPVARALTYLLITTAQPRENGARADLAQTLLNQLVEHPDDMTRRLASWAVGFRFADDGSIRPLVASAHRLAPT